MRERLRIGLTNEYYPPLSPGGAEASTQELARALVEAGHEVVVITPAYRGEAPSREAREEGEPIVWRFPTRLRYPGRPVSSVRMGQPAFYAELARGASKAARAHRLQVLHAQGRYSLPGTWLAARRLGIPPMMTLRDYASICDPQPGLYEADVPPKRCYAWSAYHSYCRSYYAPRTSLAQHAKHETAVLLKWTDAAARRSILRRTPHVVCVSEAVRNAYRELGLVGEGSRVIYNIPPKPAPSSDGADTLAKHKLTGKRIVLTPGRLSRGKGTGILLDAIESVDRRLPEDVVFVLAGRDELGLPELSSRVRWLGPVSRSDIDALYNACELVVLPSLWPEPFSRVLLESMAAGRAIIATRAGGNPEGVDDGVNGLLVARGDAPALGEAIVRMLSDRDTTARMGAAGRRVLVERFDREKLVERYEQLYADVIARSS